MPKLTIQTALMAGAAGVLMLVLALGALSNGDGIGLASTLMRYAHVLIATVWIGLIVFLNVIHIPAVREATEPERAAIIRLYVPRIAGAVRIAATWTIVSGLVLLVPTGYVLSSLVYGMPVAMPGAKVALLAAGALGGLVMMGLVHGVIGPNLRSIMAPATAPADRKAARDRVESAARINLVLVLPVVLSMIAAAHLG